MTHVHILQPWKSIAAPTMSRNVPLHVDKMTHARTHRPWKTIAAPAVFRAPLQNVDKNVALLQGQLPKLKKMQSALL
jgi:hypothetical protein